MRPAKRHRGLAPSTTPVAGPDGAVDGGMDLDTYLDREGDIPFTASDFDPQPALAKPKAVKPPFAGLQPTGPPRNENLDEVDEQAAYYTVSHDSIGTILEPA